MTFRVYPNALAEENNGAPCATVARKLIDLGRQEPFTRELIHELPDWFIGDVVDDLGSARSVLRLSHPGRGRQRRSSIETYQQILQPEAVVDRTAETEGIR
jgi:hypothetical protein